MPGITQNVENILANKIETLTLQSLMKDSNLIKQLQKQIITHFVKCHDDKLRSSKL